MNEYTTIYKLIDPRDNLIKYIGCTHNSLKKRLKDHLSDARRGQDNYRCRWIRKLMSENLVPIIESIEEVPHSKRAEREVYWISYYGRDNLVNGTDGGEGVTGYSYTDEDRKKMSDSHIGKSTWNKGISTDTSHLSEFQFKKGQNPFNKGISWGKDVLEKISNSKTGKPINRKKYSTSGFTGVVYDEKSNVWISQINVMKKVYFIGRYSEKENAGIAYDIACLWFSKEILSLNFPEKENDYLNLLNRFEIDNLKDLRIVIKNFIS